MLMNATLLILKGIKSNRTKVIVMPNRDIFLFWPKWLIDLSSLNSYKIYVKSVAFLKSLFYFAFYVLFSSVPDRIIS